jgi:nucleotide-binding universal stress UspA family protein
MPENNTVIVATDGSDHSLRVLPHANVLAQNLRAAVELLRVIERNDLTLEPGETEAAATERTRGRLESEIVADLRRSGVEGAVRLEVVPEREDPATTLLRLGSNGLVLAMHSRGRGGIARILHGSVALGVLKEVSQPVMLGGPELLAPPAGDETYKLLITTDFSPDADEVLRAISPLLDRGRFHVTLLYVHLHAPQGIDNDAERARHEASLQQKRALLPAGANVDTLLKEIPVGGGIDTAIMEAAHELGAQAIAMSTHGHSARHHVLMGSVALSILGRSRLPLIVARARG